MHVKQAAVGLAAFVVSAGQQARAEQLYADGGFVSDLDSPCLSSWTYRNQDKTTTAVSGCVSVEEFPPYPYVSFDGSATKTSADIIEPLDARTRKKFWCATNSRYNAYATTDSVREAWGYCLDKDALFPDRAVFAPGLYADGPYEDVTPCLSKWTYKYKVGGDPITEEITGCVSIDEYKPYPYYQGLEDEIDALNEPKFEGTDKSRWCAIHEEQYNPEPLKNATKKFLWGYCLEQSETDLPTVSPTPKPTPSTPATLAPSTPAPSGKPIQELAPGFYANGGFVDGLVPCVDRWEYKDVDKNKYNMSGCQRLTGPEVRHLPWPFATGDATEIENANVISPNVANTSFWCATRDVYNPFPDNNKENRLEWGYCVEILATEAPVPTPSKSPTPATQTSAPVTQAPVVPGSSNAPTTEGEKPAPTSPTDNSGRPNASARGDGNDGGKIAGIVIAVILIVTALLVIGLFAQNKYKEKKAAQQAGTTNNKPAAGAAATNQPQTDVEKQDERASLF